MLKNFKSNIKILFTASYLGCCPVDVSKFQTAVTNSGKYGWNSSSYF